MLVPPTLLLLFTTATIISLASAQNLPGRWSRVIPWAEGVIPVALVNIPGGNRVLGFSAVKPDTFRSLKHERNDRTRAQIYNPDSGAFRRRDLRGHDVFCAGITLLQDGSLLAVGGGQKDNSFRVSRFDPFTRRWTRLRDTASGHWYGTLVVTKDDRALIALGVDNNDPLQWSQGYDFPERSQKNMRFDRPWRNLSNVDFSGKGPDRNHWYPVLHLMPNGQLLESGTQNSMYTIETTGAGSIRYAGERNTRRAERESWGAATIMYEEGKLITIGGIENWRQDLGTNTFVYDRAILIDMNDVTDIRTQHTGRMKYRRAFANLVVLPSGEVLAIGGKDNTIQFDDTNSVFSPELWNPTTGRWTELARHKKPRNYHSTAILLLDGRVLSGGGGLCTPCTKNSSNQANSEILTPPYLLNDAGRPRVRPKIADAPRVIERGNKFIVAVTGANAGRITRVSIVKQSAVTHSITTDARQLRLGILGSGQLSPSQFTYQVQAKSNLNVMTPGFWFLFVLDVDGTPSVGHEIRVIR